MSSMSLRDLSDSARPERVNAISAFGFTERQARWLAWPERVEKTAETGDNLSAL
jgi:hypothetical protein